MYKVLIADDEITIREGLMNFIDWNSLDCEVAYIAENGICALEYLLEAPIDIIVTDIRMPGKSGIEIAKYVYEKKLSTKIIILSGYSDFRYAQDALSFGVIDFILKDNPLDKLEAAIKKSILLLKTEQENADLLKNIQASLSVTEEEMRIKFFMDLINGIPLTSSLIQERSGLYCRNYKNIYCVLIQIINREDKMNISFIDSIRNYLLTVYKSNLPTVFSIHASTLCLIIGDASGLNQTPFMSVFEHLLDLTSHYANYQIRITVSASHSSILELNNAYLECAYCLKQSSTQKKKIFFYSSENIASFSAKPLIGKIIKYMELNYKDQISLQDMADYVGLNSSYLSRMFKKETSQSLIGYLTNIRIERAKELLKDDSLRLADIAECTGFNDVGYFSNTFKKYTNLSPTEYRDL